MNDISHPMIHLLAIERTGWRRWVFGRWLYSSEPFRNDIAKEIRRRRTEFPVPKHCRIIEGRPSHE